MTLKQFTEKLLKKHGIQYECINELGDGCFKEGKNRKEISEETGREYSSLCRRMRKLGLGIYANTEQKRRCAGCRKLIPDNSYKFCPYCGTDIQTEEDKAITALTELYQYGSFIPSDAREKFRESIQFACKVLQKGKKREKEREKDE